MAQFPPICPLNIWISYIHIISSPSTGILRTHKWSASSWLDSSVGKNAVPVPQRSEFFFRLAFLSCLSWIHYCDGHSFTNKWYAMHTEAMIFNNDAFKFSWKFTICKWGKLEQVTCDNIWNSRETVALFLDMPNEQLTVGKTFECYIVYMSLWLGHWGPVHTKTIVNANASNRKLFNAFRPSIHMKTMKTLTVNA